MNIVSKTAQKDSPLVAGELRVDPSGEVMAGGCSTRYPRHVRNGYFKSAMNTWSNPLTASSTHVFDGWHIKKNGAVVVNAARAEVLGSGGAESRYEARVTIASNASPLASDYVILEQRTFDCVRYADKVLTADLGLESTINGTIIGVEFVLDEGNGVSSVISAGVLELGTKRKKFRVQVATPPLSGTALGSLHNMKVRYWLYGGSNYTSRFGTAINSTTGVTITFDSVSDGSRTCEPSTLDETLEVAGYFYVSSHTQFMAAAGTSVFSATAVAFTPFPAPAAYVPSPSNIVTTTSFVGSLTITPTQFGFSSLGVPNNAASSARITGYTLNIELPET
ncbi:hypothetical protein D3C77_28850 [compost metagenome]